MDDLEYWRLCDYLSIVEAALLIVGQNPDQHRFIESDSSPALPNGYIATRNAIRNALKFGLIKGALAHETRTMHLEDFEWTEVETEEIDLMKSVVAVESLKSWLTTKDFTSGFFFPNKTALPDYLDKDHFSYSPKLAGAIRAWEAIQVDSRFRDNGKTVKGNLAIWLTTNAADFDLVSDTGDVMKTAIAEIAKIANWDTGGGAPKTPERNLLAGNENSLHSSEITETGGLNDDFDQMAL